MCSESLRATKERYQALRTQFGWGQSKDRKKELEKQVISFLYMPLTKDVVREIRKANQFWKEKLMKENHDQKTKLMCAR